MLDLFTIPKICLHTARPETREQNINIAPNLSQQENCGLTTLIDLGRLSRILIMAKNASVILSSRSTGSAARPLFSVTSYAPAVC